MKLIQVIKIDKEKIDDVAYFGFAVFFAMLIWLENVVISGVITTFFILAFILFLNKDNLLGYYNSRKEIKQVEVEPKVDKIEPVREKEIVEKKVVEHDGKVKLGTTYSGKVASLRLEEIGHIFIAGMTRYGKTKLLHALISEYVKFPENEVQIAFSDAKAVSFSIFSRSKHLFAPIAKSKEDTEVLIQIILDEMYRRLELFQVYAEDNVCTNLDDYKELSGEILPRIIVIFDELADSVEPDSDSEKNLTTLAKMGLAAGIHLVLSTQRATKQGISHEIQTQCMTIMSTYMKNRIEYGSITKIPQVIYNDMKPVKGLFMLFSPELAPFFLQESENYEGWGFVQADYLDNLQVKAVAESNRGLTRQLPSLEKQELEKLSWEGTEEDKLNNIQILEERLGRDLEIQDLCVTFDINSRTASKWHTKYYA